MGNNSGQHLTAAGKYPRLDPMAASDTLAALLNRQLEALGFSVADAARKTGLSYRQMYRLCTDRSHHIQPRTVDKLELLGWGCNNFYDGIVRNAVIQEHWEYTEGQDSEWVRATFTAPRHVMESWIGKHRQTFNAYLSKLEEAGVIVERSSDEFEIRRYKKRSDEGVKDSDIKIMAQNISILQEQMGQLISLMTHEKSPDSGAKNSRNNAKNSRNNAKNSRNNAKNSRPINKDHRGEKKRSLSLDQIVDLFYTGIGQKKISGEKRERALIVLKDLGKDGFDPEDIEFAIKWTLQNSKEQPYDLAILKHTIGQALADRDKVTAQEREGEEQERRRREEDERKEREAEELREVDEYRSKLNESEREELNNEALLELRGNPEVRNDMINDFLINLKEKEIIRRRLERTNEGGD